MAEKFVIIDGPALLHRAWHALPPLTTKKGEVVNALYGFVLIFLKVLKELKPNYLAIAFDLPGKTFRHKEYKEYKATRAKQPPEFYQQIPKVKELLQAFNVAIFEKENFEADDLIGVLSKKIKDNIENIIVTGDLDTLQLVDEKTKVYILKKGITETQIYDLKAVKERFGLEPKQLIDFKALRGDPSDNLPGVKGIGEKTALELIKKFGNIENLYKNLEKVKEKTRKLLLENKEKAFLSKKLVKIRSEIPLKIDFEDLRKKNFDRGKIIKLFQEWEFKSLFDKIPKEEIKVEEKISKEKVNYFLIDNEEKFKDFFEKLKKQKAFALDTETTSLDPLSCKLIGISFSWQEGEAYFIKSSELGAQSLEFKEILENEKIEKYGHNIKYDLEVLRENNIDLKGIDFDTMVASYLLNPGSRAHSLDTITFIEFGYQMISLDELLISRSRNMSTLRPNEIGTMEDRQMSMPIDAEKNNKLSKKEKIKMEEIPIEKLSWYSCEDADYTFRLVKKLKQKLEENLLLNLFKEIEMPLIPVLAEMERNGVKINEEILKNLAKEVEKKFSKIQRETYKLAGCEFNINSPQQLKEVLFKKLKISSEKIKKTKTGLSTAKEELEKLRGKHPIIDLIFEHRELSKLKSTYINALPKLINSKTQRIHTSFNQTITATGRLSSSDPNLQNIPIRTELGQKIRRAFIAEKDHYLISADYSQIELRIIASLANDEKMIESFRDGEDIHSKVASEFFNCKVEEVTKEMRRVAKTVDFGILYGMGPHGLAETLKISKKEAENYIEQYFKIHKKIREFIENTIVLTHSLGYAETLFGRKRYLPEINSEVVLIRNQAERMAINFPMQGTASDLMKMAMIEINKKIKEAKMILQVHDELVFEVEKEKLEKVAKEIKEIMENVIKLKVPIEVEISYGENWADLAKVITN